MSLIVIAKDDDNFTYGFQYEWKDTVEDIVNIQKLQDELLTIVKEERIKIVDEQRESDTDESDNGGFGILADGEGELFDTESSEDTDQALPDDGSEKLDMS